MASESVQSPSDQNEKGTNLSVKIASDVNQNAVIFEPVCSLSGFGENKLLKGGGGERICDERFVRSTMPQDFAIMDEDYPVWMSALSVARIRHLFLIDVKSVHDYLTQLEKWGAIREIKIKFEQIGYHKIHPIPFVWSILLVIS